jgi:hypothetical protein
MSSCFVGALACVELLQLRVVQQVINVHLAELLGPASLLCIHLLRGGRGWGRGVG